MWVPFSFPLLRIFSVAPLLSAAYLWNLLSYLVSRVAQEGSAWFKWKQIRFIMLENWPDSLFYCSFHLLVSGIPHTLELLLLSWNQMAWTLRCSYSHTFLIFCFSLTLAVFKKSVLLLFIHHLCLNQNLTGPESIFFAIAGTTLHFLCGRFNSVRL